VEQTETQRQEEADREEQQETPRERKRAGGARERKQGAPIHVKKISLKPKLWSLLGDSPRHEFPDIAGRLGKSTSDVPLLTAQGDHDYRVYSP